MPNRMDKPKVFNLKRGDKGWKLGRRSFIAGVGASGLLIAGKDLSGRTLKGSDRTHPAKNPKCDFCHRIGTHVGGVWELAFSPDGSLLVTGADQTVWEECVKLWGLPTGNILASLKHPDGVSGMAVSPNGKWLLTCDSEGKLRLWNLKTRKLKKTVSTKSGYIFQVEITPNGKFAVSLGWQGAVKLWSFPKLKFIKSFGTIGADQAFAISPDGKMLATGYFGELPVIGLYSLEEGEVGKLINKFGDYRKMDEPDCYAFSPDGKYLVSSAAIDKEIRIWNVPEGTIYKSFQPYKGTGPNKTILSPDGKYLATTEMDDYAKVFKFPTGKLLKELAKDGDDDAWKMPYSVAFTPDNKYLYVGHNNRVGKWNFKTGKLLGCFMDINATISIRKGSTYKYRGEDGKLVTVTVPACKCAPKMPADAVCTCDTVDGKIPAGGCSVVYYYPN